MQGVHSSTPQEQGTCLVANKWRGLETSNRRISLGGTCLYRSDPSGTGTTVVRNVEQCIGYLTYSKLDPYRYICSGTVSVPPRAGPCPYHLPVFLLLSGFSRELELALATCNTVLGLVACRPLELRGRQHACAHGTRTIAAVRARSGGGPVQRPLAARSFRP